MSATLIPWLVPKFFANDGSPLAFGNLYSYAAGTTTPLPTFSDSTGMTPNPNPVQLNYRGEAAVWIQPNTGYKFNLTDAAGNQIPGYPVDNVINSQITSFYGGVDTGVAN